MYSKLWFLVGCLCFFATPAIAQPQTALKSSSTVNYWGSIYSQGFGIGNVRSGIGNGSISVDELRRSAFLIASDAQILRNRIRDQENRAFLEQIAGKRLPVLTQTRFDLAYIRNSFTNEKYNDAHNPPGSWIGPTWSFNGLTPHSSSHTLDPEWRENTKSDPPTCWSAPQLTSNGDGPAVAYVKQILTDPKAGWDLSSWNSGLPSGWNGVTCPYTIYESSEKNLWFWNHKMKINNEEWLTALRDYMMDVVSDLDFDGVLVSATKRQQYTNTGGPDTRLPVACNAIESTGTNLLFHWTKLGNAGVCHPGVPLLNQCFDSDSNATWDVYHDKPSFRGTGKSWRFAFYESTRLDWFYGFIKHFDLMRSATSACDKKLAVDWYSFGVHPFGWAFHFISDIQNDRGITQQEAADYFYGEILRTVTEADYAYIRIGDEGSLMPDDFWKNITRSGTPIIDPTSRGGN